MAATPAQIAANRINAQRSTGPKTIEGKEAARRNALKHGLTGGGVVLPGEDEQEVAIREAALKDQLVVEGDVLGGALVRQIAIASIRVERAFRCETALAAERMRKAPEVVDDQRLVLAQEILGEIAIDPVTIRRRLLEVPEGINALIVRLRALRVQTDTTRLILWEEEEGKELDQILGNRPGQAPLSRAGLLTRGIAFDHWLGLDPAEFAEMDFTTRLNWAVGEVRKIIDAEIAALEEYRANLDTTRHDRDRAEAAERQLLDLSKDGIALRRYAGAAERSMLKMLQELRLARVETKPPTPERSPLDPAPIGNRGQAPARFVPEPVRFAATDTPAKTAPSPTPAAEPARAVVTELPIPQEVRRKSGSFCARVRERSRGKLRKVIEALEVEPQASIAPFSAARGGPVGS